MMTAVAYVAGAASRSKATTDPLARIHPDLRATAAKLLKDARSAAPLSIATLEAMRLGDAALARPMLIDVPVTEHRITYDPNTPPVTVYVVNSKSGDARPAILHTHGGGFIGGSAKGSRRQLQELARTLGCVIVSVEYGLAQERDLAVDGGSSQSLAHNHRSSAVRGKATRWLANFRIHRI